MRDGDTAAAPSRRSLILGDLVSIARPDYWPKHVFILPGILAAFALTGSADDGVLVRIALGFLSAMCVASSNYVINEWLDAEFDRHHPHKRSRPAALGRLSAPIVYAEYLVLALVGLLLAAAVSRPFLITSGLFLLSGISYNVPPFRTKERVYLDVMTEAVNNPIRLLLGWFMVSSVTVPPLSLLLLYWCGGAFLMSTKRLAEYRFLEAVGHDVPARYRKSFGQYDQRKLLLTCFLYGVLTSFAVAVFLVKYRSEFVLTVPLFAWLFSHYFYTALGDASIVQTPEKFYRQRGLMPIVMVLVVAIVILAMVDIPVIDELIQSRFTAVDLQP